LRKEREEREERERQQREQMERVERQAKELEERLARLATSMPPAPQATMVDSAAATVQPGVRTGTIGNNSFPGADTGATLYDSLPPAAVVSVPAKSKGNSLLLIGAAVVLVVLIGGAIGAFFLLRSRVAPVAGPGPTPVPTATPAIPEGIKPDMVEIPGGTFQMGRNDGPPQERPIHPVTVQKFYMDRTEVTNAEYADFIRDTNYEPPSDWIRGKPLAGQERWPVGNVSAKDAQAFAAWRSKRDGVTYRLPTEEEWEFAARNGGEFKLFPWGDSFEDGRAVVKGASPRQVGSIPEGKDRWGVLDLIGNVSEWTSSKASVYSGLQIPDANKDWIVLRGGSYASDPSDQQIPISATYRDWFSPTLRHPTFGFRLVRPSE
jgi:formylglycine-generating enzyme required for sulfatase activity